MTHTPTQKAPSIANVLQHIPLFRDDDDENGGLEELARAIKLPAFDAEIEQEALADLCSEHIVRCVNSHDALVEAEKTLTQYSILGLSLLIYARSSDGLNGQPTN